MRHYPLFMNLEGKKAVVFGAGAVALRKIKSLLKGGARVDVASRDYSKAVMALSRRSPKLQLRRSAPPSSLLKDAVLVFAATSDARFNQKIARLSRRKKIPVNVADEPRLSDFFVPAHFKKGKLEIAISTGGVSPLLAQRLRRELFQKIRPEAIRLLNRMKNFRRLAFSTLPSQKGRKRFLEQKLGRDFHFLSERNGDRLRTR